MTAQQNFFVRPASEDEINIFKKILNRWGVLQPGSTETQLGDKIKVESCRCCHVTEINLDVMAEKRTRQLETQPIRKGTISTTPKVGFNVLDIWTPNTPSYFSKEFKETFDKAYFRETERYLPCNSCGESGKVDCGPCQKTGIMDCPRCDAYGKYKCLNCEGHGGFGCKTCNSMGQVIVDCGTCQGSKKRDCNSCGGRGEHYTNSGSYKCRDCNGSGKDYCAACGGSGEKVVTCGSCKGDKGYVCGKCHGDKYMACEVCRTKKTVPCKVCNGNKENPCEPCKTLGGFNEFESVMMSTHIYQNKYTVSPVENIRSNLSISMKQEFNETLDEISTNRLNELIKDKDLSTIAGDLLNYVHTEKPATTLLEQMRLFKGSFLEMDFAYNGATYSASIDFRNENVNSIPQDGNGMYVPKNPLAGQMETAKLELQKKFNSAKEAKDVERMTAVAAEAKEQRFLDLANSWNQATQSLKKELADKAQKASDAKELAETIHFVNFIIRPAHFIVPMLAYLVIGFVVPLSLFYLFVWVGIGLWMLKDQSTDYKRLQPHKSRFKSDMVKLMLFIIVTAGLAAGAKYAKQELTYERRYLDGAEF